MSNSRLSDFIAARARETYPEPRTAGHDDLTARMAALVAPHLSHGASILDVGAGQGPALEWFTANGFSPLGIALGQEDVDACIAAGFRCEQMDQNDMTFTDRAFDCVWARHVLEHSVIPLFTLTEFARVLQPLGILYAEMPAPDTACAHQTNANHYSVFPASCWQSLIERAGFEILETRNINLQTGMGPDVYHSFIARKL
jgi:2-polyprenyl-3-methyl-5-hydroxy-6-metoxy-1,4-benzoquinol methylase